MVTVILDSRYGLGKAQLIQWMARRKIDCRPFFHPLSSLPAYQKSPNAHEASIKNTISYRISPLGVNLPSGMDLTERKVRVVCDTLKEALAEASSNSFFMESVKPCPD